ncbi:MAG TPA: nucleoside 2-deoxyribosyltransferase domain-containing protein [Polyangiaceae bacterium]|nr:nucleoside 2-deoxyribosyltransferase domain-containing protein [Polyangiaceae bacterium]
MNTPTGPYIALYGSHSGDWREPLKARLEREGVAYYDPTDEGWRRITPENGDERQAEIDALVANEHAALRGATCVVFHLARRLRVGGVVHDDQTTLALASRAELGFVTGRGVVTFVHIEPDVEGRNYLWAQMKPYPHMVRCASLDEALERALAAFRAMAGAP